MRKLLLTLMVTVAFSCSVIAQQSHWPDFNDGNFEDHGDLVAVVSINDDMIEATDGDYDSELDAYIIYRYEIAAFTGETCRGRDFLYYYEGDEYAITNMMGIFYDEDTQDMGKEVSFKLYDHVNSIEYYICNSSEPILTGNDYDDISYWMNPVVLSFYSAFTTDIEGFGSDEGNWYLIASPLLYNAFPGDVLNMTENEYDIYRFNQEADLEWENWKNEDVELNHYHFEIEPGMGYLYANSEDVTLTFVGSPYDGPGVVTLKNCGGQQRLAGWNLIGNPFNETVAIYSRDFYIMNPEGRNELILAEKGTLIAPMEGVFVHADETGETVTFEREIFKSYSDEERIVVNLSKKEGRTLDRVMVRFGDSRPFLKYMMDENHTNISIKQDGNQYAVVNGTGVDMMPISFHSGEMVEYVLSVNVDNADVSYLHLIDHETGADIDMLMNKDYAFIGTPNDRQDRFELRFNEHVNTESEIFAYQNGNNIIVTGEGTLQIYDVMGRMVSSMEIHGVETLSGIDAGTYVFRVLGESQKTQKLVVR